MPSPATAPTQAGPPELEGRSGWTIGRVVSITLVIGMVVFWSWALSPWAPSGHPDELDDDTFAVAAEPLCAAAVAEVAETVPLAVEATDARDRADQIDAATEIFEELHRRLTELAPPTGTSDGDLVALWLADWATYLGDRRAYAADFRAGVDAAFVVTARDGDQVTSPIDSFANANSMVSCVTPTDV